MAAGFYLSFTRMRSIEILGVRVDDVTMAEALALAGEMIDGPAASCRQVVSVNPEFIMTARRNPAFARVLAASDLNLTDGANLIRAARWLGLTLRERVAGSDLAPRLAARAAERGWRLYLLGAAEGVAAQAAANLQKEHSQLQVVGTWAGSPALREEDELVKRVNASGAQVLLVAYGAPAQDLWIARNRERLAARVAIGVGGTFDFIAGRVPRAPLWMQHAGLEWLFRLARQPWRIKRQAALAGFVWLVLRERLHGREDNR
ncbi:MAG: WecB/TagA/CpsF family glycosyltransferase [Anaerolineae bacterium]